MRRRLRHLRLSLLLALMALALAPTVARAQLSVLGHTVQEYVSVPGQVQTGTVLVENASAAPQTVRVYLSDYSFDASGETRYDPPATRPRSNAAWVSIEASQVTVPPGATVPVRYSVRTPPGLTAAGTFWSLLMVEPVAADVGPTGAGKIALATSVRYAVQVVTHVSAGGSVAAGAPAAAANAQISPPHVVREEKDTLVVEFDLANSGEIGYRPELSLELVDASGHSVGTFRQKRGLLYPGTSLRQRFECPGVPRGAYRAVIVADAGDDVFGTQLSITW